MEGRVPPPGADPADDPSFRPRFRRPPSPPPLAPLPYIPEPSDKETYIVQIPRDQVYRVPPPENARIVESYQRPGAKKTRCTGCPKWCLWVFIALIVVGAMVGAAVAIYQVFFNPTSPEFSINKVSVKHPTASGKKHAPSGPSRYLVTLEVDNPNSKMSIAYGAGTASLVHNSKAIADGNCEPMSQSSSESTIVEVLLEGNNKLTVGNSKKTVDLSLTIEAPITIKSVMRWFGKNMKVTCHFKVSGLASSHPKIVSEKCSTESQA